WAGEQYSRGGPPSSGCSTISSHPGRAHFCGPSLMWSPHGQPALPCNTASLHPIEPQRTANRVATRRQVDLEACGCSPDRKSTRLNSSHVKISYAVFCLKKK